MKRSNKCYDLAGLDSNSNKRCRSNDTEKGLIDIALNNSTENYSNSWLNDNYLYYDEESNSSTPSSSLQSISSYQDFSSLRNQNRSSESTERDQRIFEQSIDGSLPQPASIFNDLSFNGGYQYNAGKLNSGGRNVVTVTSNFDSICIRSSSPISTIDKRRDSPSLDVNHTYITAGFVL